MTLADSTSLPLSDPRDEPALLAAAQWVLEALSGTVATVVAVIAVASIGFLMLTGRLKIARGATVLIGCFILFGAQSIALALKELATEATQPAGPIGSTAPTETRLAPTTASSPNWSRSDDSYAGASPQ